MKKIFYYAIEMIGYPDRYGNLLNKERKLFGNPIFYSAQELQELVNGLGILEPLEINPDLIGKYQEEVVKRLEDKGFFLLELDAIACVNS